MSKEQFFEEYLPILKELRKEYSDKIDISIGLEVEYYGDEGEKNEIISASRKEIEGELDYMILGQHFVIARDNNGKMMNPPKENLNQLLSHKLFSCIFHPQNTYHHLVTTLLSL